MRSKHFLYGVLSTSMFVPSFVYSAEGVTLRALVVSFNETIIQSLAGLFIIIATVAFFFGVARYILGFRNGDEETMKNGKSFLLQGLIALFVMVSIWGIIAATQKFFTIKGDATITIPASTLKIK